MKITSNPGIFQAIYIYIYIYIYHNGDYLLRLYIADHSSSYSLLLRTITLQIFGILYK